MRKPSLCASLSFAICIAAGCSPGIQSARFSDVPSRPATNEVLLYSTRVPECAYEEIGLISGKRRGFWMSLDDVLHAMRQRAREMGGDAIVGLGAAQFVSSSGVGETASVNTQEGMSGAVVRFEDPDCRR